MMTSRLAMPGERCTCGRQAREVFEFDDRAPIGYCGISDGGDQEGPCPFCGEQRHDGATCPRYQLRPEGTAWERHDDPQAQG
jgi:hypothetical protein